ncbi:hypothetical protein JOQ06_014783, partial [Pogonophryne albipinna]
MLSEAQHLDREREGRRVELQRCKRYRGNLDRPRSVIFLSLPGCFAAADMVDVDVYFVQIILIRGWAGEPHTSLTSIHQPGGSTSFSPLDPKSICMQHQPHTPNTCPPAASNLSEAH